MSKGLKVLFTILVLLVGVLAASTGFFYAKVKTLTSGKTTKKTATSESTKKVTSTETVVKEESKVEEKKEDSSTTTSITEPAPLGNRPSSPSETVKIEPGETLFAVGQKVGVSWTVLAEVNGIDANKIKAGQTIIVPKNNQVSYTINQEKAKSLQVAAEGGKDIFRFSPVDTAKSDSPPVYGLLTTNTFVQNKVDLTAGTATVKVTSGDKTYTISLTQPTTKGEKGIWAIESIKEDK